MASVDFATLAEAVLAFAKQPRSVVFSGAGVGKLANLPVWPDYLDALADTCEKWGDKPSADLMRQRTAKWNYLGAAAVFESSDEIPEGERWKAMAAPFAREFTDVEINSLKPLFGLPFSAVVTTNYDRSQYDAISLARGRSPIPLELDDDSLRNGALQSNVFMARLHGRAERPTSIILTPTAYQRIAKNDFYKDFLLTLLRERPCFFIGFSFVDPAINNILDIYEHYAGPDFAVLHSAAIPEGGGSDALRKRLLKLSFNVLEYDPANDHRELWRGIRKAEADYRRELESPILNDPPPTRVVIQSSFKRFFAFTYAQIHTASELRPLVEQTRDGVVLTLIREAGGDGVPHAALLTAVQKAFQFSEEEASPLVRDSLARLLTTDDIRSESGLYFALSAGDSEPFNEHITELVKGVLDRLKVREGVSPDDDDALIIRDILERILVVRAWDVSAHYAGGGTGYNADIGGVAHSIVEDAARGRLESRRRAIERSVLDILSSPSDLEAEPLAELGRTAFALQLVLASPRQTLLRRFSLPQKIYLDASVLLPALVPGHPWRQLYLDTFKRLRQASREAGVSCEIVVGEPFLNEVIAHRERAIRTALEWDINNPNRLRQLITLRGRQEDVNVFIGGYASRVGRVPSRDRPKFLQFLRQAAPYSSEEELARYLLQQGFKVAAMDFRHAHHLEYSQVFNPLVAAYEGQKSDKLDILQKILVEHEAQQLTQLEIDESRGIRSIFVSADRSLYRAILSSSKLHHFSSAAVSPEGFFGLVDIMVGLKTDGRAMARLIWAAPKRGVDQAIRDYLVRRALEEMDVAYAKAMPELIDSLVKDAKEELTNRNLDLFSDAEEDIAKTAKFIDRLENDFFSKMRRAIEKDE